MKNYFLPFLLSAFFLQPFAHADIYMKATTGGIAEQETWTSGKKQRESIRSQMGGLSIEKIKIVRADKGVEWQINHKLKMYQEKSIALEPGSSEEMTPEEAKEFEKMSEAEPSAEPEATTACTKVIREKEPRTYAGFSAHGYRADCPDSQTGTMTFWMADENGEIQKIKKEMDVFQQAYTEAMYAKFPKAQREQMIKMMTLLGKSMAGGLMGMPDPDKLPKTLPLAMETFVPVEEGGQMPGMDFKTVELKRTSTDASLYEIPEGYQKVENLEQLESQEMMNQFAGGGAKLSDLVGGLGQMAEHLGMPKDEADQAVEDSRAGDPMGRATAGFVKDQMQMQGVWEQPDMGTPLQAPVPPSVPSPAVQNPTDLPIEPWQQGLYQNTNTAPGYAQRAPVKVPSAPERRAPVPYKGANNQMQETLDKVQNITSSIENITANLSGGVGGLAGGLQPESFDSYGEIPQDGEYEEYAEEESYDEYETQEPVEENY